MFQGDRQPLVDQDTAFEIEHVFAKRRAEVEGLGRTTIESLGNKAMLEKRINVRASDYRFEDKRRYYRGFLTARGYRDGTKNRELLNLSEQADFTVADIKSRTAMIIGSFLDYLGENGLLARRYPTRSWIARM